MSPNLNIESKNVVYYYLNLIHNNSLEGLK